MTIAVDCEKPQTKQNHSNFEQGSHSRRIVHESLRNCKNYVHFISQKIDRKTPFFIHFTASLTSFILFEYLNAVLIVFATFLESIFICKIIYVLLKALDVKVNKSILFKFFKNRPNNTDGKNTVT